MKRDNFMISFISTNDVEQTDKFHFHRKRFHQVNRAERIPFLFRPVSSHKLTNLRILGSINGVIIYNSTINIYNNYMTNFCGIFVIKSEKIIEK